MLPRRYDTCVYTVPAILTLGARSFALNICLIKLCFFPAKLYCLLNIMNHYCSSLTILQLAYFFPRTVYSLSSYLPVATVYMFLRLIISADRSTINHPPVDQHPVFDESSLVTQTLVNTLGTISQTNKRVVAAATCVAPTGSNIQSSWAPEEI